MKIITKKLPIRRIMSLFLAAVLTFALPPVLVAQDSESDMTVYSDWAKEFVTIANEIGLIPEGVGDDYTAPISRLLFCELIYNTLGEELRDVREGDNPFNDTANNAIVSLWRAGIANGKADGIFAPDDLLTREEAAAFLVRTADAVGIEKPDDILSVGELYDDEDISDWAAEPVASASALGLMIGTAERMFSPASTFSIEQAITTSVRLAKLADVSESFTARLTALIDDDNYFVSPLSIEMALALAANGAVGNTQAEILTALGLDGLDAFNTSAKELISRYNGGRTIKLDIANSIWINSDRSEGMTFSEAFQKLASEYYYVENETVTDDNAVNIVNGWVDDKTNGKIPTILDDSEFAALIVNAIYFKGAWEKSFDKADTYKGEFNNASGSVAEVEFMTQTDYFNYAEYGGLKIIELPYSNFFNEDNKTIYESERGASMYIILGEGSYDAEKIIANANFKRTFVELTIPKFKTENSFELKDILEAMGIVTGFDHNKADFTDMVDGGNMFMTDVLHKTYIDVDEEGTEAAAVTAIFFATTSIIMDPEPIVFKADNPFNYIIRENTSAKTLFAGRLAQID